MFVVFDSRSLLLAFVPLRCDTSSVSEEAGQNKIVRTVERSLISSVRDSRLMTEEFERKMTSGARPRERREGLRGLPYSHPAELGGQK
jgi:hypothetical protein